MEKVVAVEVADSVEPESVLTEHELEEYEVAVKELETMLGPGWCIRDAAHPFDRLYKGLGVSTHTVKEWIITKRLFAANIHMSYTHVIDPIEIKV